MRSLLYAAAAVVVFGCGTSAGISPPSSSELTYTAPPGTGTTGTGDFGATVGGVQDVGQLRAQVKAGLVPAPGLVMAEGLFAEHDFPVEGGACTDLFCARPAAGRHPSRASGKETLFVHVGMLSGLSAEWKRPPADIMVAVDKGASMAIDLKETMEGIALMVDRLGPDDRFGAVIFDDTATVLVPLGPLTDKAAVKAKLLAVPATGGFAGVLDGATRAFAALAAAKQPGRLSRMMMFACGMPPTTDARFKQALETNAAAGIGFSFFGILMGGDYHSMRAFTELHGGNAFFLNDLEKVKKVFDTDLDLMITPLAYDFSMKLAATGATVKRVFGLPKDLQAVEAKTLFPSRNKGAIVLELEAPAEAEAASLVAFELSYREALGAAAVQGAAALVPETKGGVRKAAALVNLADGLTGVLETWAAGERDDAREQLEALEQYLTAEAVALDDAGLRGEVELLAALRANMK